MLIFISFTKKINIFLKRKPFFLGLVLFITVITLTGTLYARDHSSDPLNSMKRVLVINSYHSGYVWGDSVIAGINEVFHSSDIHVNIRYEFMDTKHLRPEVIFQQLRHLFAIKYANFQFDVILATDNNALNFLLLYRDELFPNTPVVFCGINGYRDDMIAGYEDFTGFGENSDMKGTVEVALKIHPNTKYIAYVSGTSTSSVINQARMRDIIPAYEDRVQFIDLSRLNPEQLRTKLQRLPEHTVIIYLSYYKMEDGTFLTVQESTSLVFDYSGLPMYSPWEYTMGYGMIGGMMLSGHKEGQRAAYYALKLLSGIPIKDLPVVYSSDIQPIFDFRMLDHFHISHSNLPPKSHIINEPQTIYYRYKYWIWAIAIFVCYQTATIVWLSHNLMRRKRAEKVQKQLEEQLLHSQKMEAIGTFAGGIAHDLNNILGAIGTCSELALEDTPDSDPVHEDLKHVLSATERGKSLIRQILDFSRKRDLERKSINMKEMVKECVTLLKQVIPPSIETRVEIMNGDCFVFANPAKVHQIVMNLCTNAEQAMRGRNGLMKVGLDKVAVDKKKSLVQLDLPAGEYIRLVVSDTGRGISKGIQTRIFDPFFTTRNQTEGTGLGLAVVHGITTGYGGTVTVNSKLGKGSTFIVYLPAVSSVEEVMESPDGEKPPGGHEKIMLIDDDEDVLYSGKKLLGRAGYNVRAFHKSMEAIAAFEKDAEKFDLIITDQVMPNITGLELSKRAKIIRKDIPIVLCSGHIDHNINSEIISEYEIDEFVQKPFSTKELLEGIRRALATTANDQMNLRSENGPNTHC